MATWLIQSRTSPYRDNIFRLPPRRLQKKGAEASPDQTHLLQQQISELQAAASQNATHVKELAEQLQGTVAAIEQAASVAKSNQQRAGQFSLGR
jgi:hypothetical protein